MLIIVKPKMVLWYLVLAQNVKISLDNKTLLKILHANLIIFQAFICLNQEGPIYIYKCSVKTYIVEIFKNICNGQSKIYNSKYFNQTPMPKILNIYCMCLINPLYHIIYNMALHKGPN
jgi:hypothetical protein